MDISIRVSVLGRPYTLRVDKANEARTRALVEGVNRRLRAFKSAHPEQPETTALVITALALAEEADQARRDLEALSDEMERLCEQFEATTEAGGLQGPASA